MGEEKKLEDQAKTRNEDVIRCRHRRGALERGWEVVKGVTKVLESG